MDLYIVNYRHANSAALKSITQLPKDEAFALAKRLHVESPCRAHKRFGASFAWYYEHRLRTEQWLHEQFIALGGQPQTNHPFYFVLQGCDSLHDNFDRGETLRIALHEIDPRHVSFTFGDSCKFMDSPQRQRPFLMDELLAHIASHGNAETFLRNLQPYDFIEAQLWIEPGLTHNLLGGNHAARNPKQNPGRIHIRPGMLTQARSTSNDLKTRTIAQFIFGIT